MNVEPTAERNESDQSVQRQVSIVITGGGTGGHLFPAIAVGEALLRLDPNIDLLFIGRETERERSEVEKRNIPFIGYHLAGLKRKWTLKNLLALSRFFLGVLKATWVLRKKTKGVVFGVGGYVSAPAMLAGKLLGWKLTLHEQNTVPGMVNRKMAAWCHDVFVTYAETQARLKNRTCTLSGFPLRNDLLNAHRQSTKDGERSEHNPPSILIMGGSQGARKLVKVGIEACRILDQRGIPYQALIQTGERNFEWAQQHYDLDPPARVTLTAFIDDMAKAYGDADCVVSRAGSGSLSELALWGLPSILVPFPYASDDHQRINAECFTNANAAHMCHEHELTSERLAEELTTLLTHQNKRNEMRKNAIGLARENAAETIAQRLLDLALSQAQQCKGIAS